MQWSPAEIKRRRDAKGMSQQELADALDVSRRAVTNWETGQSEPRGRNINSLDRVLGDTTTPEVSLHDATVMELLAELAGRYATLEAIARRGAQPGATDGSSEHYTWYKDDALTARRSSAGGQSPHQRGQSG